MSEVAEQGNKKQGTEQQRKSKKPCTHPQDSSSSFVGEGSSWENTCLRVRRGADARSVDHRLVPYPHQAPLTIPVSSFQDRSQYAAGGGGSGGGHGNDSTTYTRDAVKCRLLLSFPPARWALGTMRTIAISSSCPCGWSISSSRMARSHML